MIDRNTKLRWRRRFRKRKRQVEDFSEQADQLAERHFFRRLGKLADVRRFVAAWVLLVLALVGITIAQTVALDRFYQTEGPIPGGTFTEGMVGSFTNANPLYATGAVDNAVSRLVFASLFKYNQDNQLVGDLAEKWDVDERGVRYTVFLKPDLVWHDDQPLTADDVVFTYETIQKPDAKSPLLSSWRGIKVQAADPHTVIFTLPNALSSFPHALTNGIIPKHALSNVPISQLRSVRFNNMAPIGAGPFKWETTQVSGTDPQNREERIGLLASSNYHSGEPKLERFIIRSFRQEQNLLQAFKLGEVDAMTGLQNLPDDVKDQDDSIHEYSVPLTGQVNVFFKTNQGVFTDQKVRQALVQSVNVGAVVGGLGYPAIVSRAPLLESHIGYSKDLLQLPYNTAAANKLLDESGWMRGADGLRAKGNQQLSFRLFAATNGENAYLTQALQKAWREIGVNVEVVLQPDTDLQSTASNHNYDAILYGIALGSDPDVYAYWHSSQADVRSGTRLNFSEYKSTVADRALEAGRTRADPEVRAVKYQPFLTVWSQDAPAVSLFQPRFLYISHDPVNGLDPKSMNTATDRYANVENWMIRRAKVNL